jgi:DNA-binding MarR family transcriptional regulator
MHGIYFSLKRTYHRFLATTRRPLACYGLTAARLDLLYALSGVEFLRSQRELERVLGVSAPTVSRMLKSLEELGFVERCPAIHDARRRIVALTYEGRQIVRRALRDIVHSGAIELVVESVIARCAFAIARFAEIYELDATLRRARSRLGDVATLVYPWHPDD